MMTNPITPALGLHLNCRNENPDTSRNAYLKHSDRGTLATHREKVMKAVLSRPGHTAAEIGGMIDLEHVEAQRRLSDLARDGRIYKRGTRKCNVKGSAMMLWWPKNIP